MDEPDPCIENPWQVESLSCYLFYCCPECDVRSKTHQEFVNHAVGNHKMAVVLLRNKTILNQVASDQNQEKQSKTVCAPLDQSDPLQLHEEPKDIQSDSLTIKEEINEDDNLVSIDEYENQQDVGEMMDPLDVLPEEEVKDVLLDSSNLTAKDCSILTIPSHLSEVELKQLCLKHFDDQFYQKNNISVIEKKLQRKLKMIHPIFQYLIKMSQEKLDMLFSLHDENVVSDVSKTMMCKKLRKIYFAKHPLNPLASLIKDERSIIVHISREGLKTCNDEFEVGEVNELSDYEEFDNSHMADYSVLNIPMNLDSSLRGVMKTLSEQLHLEVNSKRDTKWYARRLSSFLRECHPIHRYIANLPKDQFDALYRRTFANGLAPFLEIPKVWPYLITLLAAFCMFSNFSSFF